MSRKRQRDRDRRPAAPAAEPRVEWVGNPDSGENAFTQGGFLAALAQLLREARDREVQQKATAAPAPPHPSN
jgi:hypothetical protein